VSLPHQDLARVIGKAPGPNEIADQPLELLARLNKRNQSCGSTSPLERTDPLNAAQGVALW